MPNRSYLINGRVVTFYPALAKKLGNVNKALVIQQIHYLVTAKEEAGVEYTLHEGHQWVYAPYEELCIRYFDWISPVQLKRIMLDLEVEGVIITTQGVRNSWHRAKWYRIDYDVLDEIMAYEPPKPEWQVQYEKVKAEREARIHERHVSVEQIVPSDQNDTMTSDQNDPMDEINMIRSLQTKAKEGQIVGEDFADAKSSQQTATPQENKTASSPDPAHSEDSDVEEKKRDRGKKRDASPSYTAQLRARAKNFVEPVHSPADEKGNTKIADLPEAHLARIFASTLQKIGAATNATRTLTKKHTEMLEEPIVLKSGDKIASPIQLYEAYPAAIREFIEVSLTGFYTTKGTESRKLMNMTGIIKLFINAERQYYGLIDWLAREKRIQLVRKSAKPVQIADEKPEQPIQTDGDPNFDIVDFISKSLREGNEDE